MIDQPVSHDRTAAHGQPASPSALLCILSLFVALCLSPFRVRAHKPGVLGHHPLGVGVLTHRGDQSPRARSAPKAARCRSPPSAIWQHALPAVHAENRPLSDVRRSRSQQTVAVSPSVRPSCLRPPGPPPPHHHPLAGRIITLIAGCIGLVPCDNENIE